MKDRGSRHTYRTTYDEDPLFLPLHPLNDFVRTLGKSIPACVRPGHTVELEQRGHPGQGYRVPADAVIDLQMRVLRMHARVEGVIQRQQFPTIQHGGEVRLEGGHHELHVALGFVQEMPDHGARHDVCWRGAALADRRADRLHAVIFVEFVDELVAHLAEFVEGFLVGADEEDGDGVLRDGDIFGVLDGLVVVVVVGGGGGGRGGGHEADVHIQIAVLVEAGEADGDPVLATAGFDAAGFEEHVEDQLEIAGVQGVFPGSGYAYEATAGHDEAVEERWTSGSEEGVIDDLALGFLHLQTFQCGQ